MGPKGRALLAAWIDLTMGAPVVAAPHRRRRSAATPLQCEIAGLDVLAAQARRAAGCSSCSSVLDVARRSRPRRCRSETSGHRNCQPAARHAGDRPHAPAVHWRGSPPATIRSCQPYLGAGRRRPASPQAGPEANELRNPVHSRGGQIVWVGFRPPWEAHRLHVPDRNAVSARCSVMSSRRGRCRELQGGRLVGWTDRPLPVATASVEVATARRRMDPAPQAPEGRSDPLHCST